MRDPESQTPATSPGLQALSHSHGSPWLEPFPVPEIKGSQNPKQSPDTGVSAQRLPERWKALGTQNGKCPARPGPPRPGLLAPGLHARGCSPRASTPGAARYGSLCLKPFLYLKDGLTPIKTPAKLWVPCSETPRGVRKDRMHKMCSAPARPGPPRPGLYLSMAH